MSETDRGDRLVAEELRADLRTVGIAKEIVVVDEAGSTNDLVWDAFERGAQAGFIVFAERQTAGRGQYGRRWESTAGKGLWFSMLLRPAMTLNESPRLTLLLADAIAAAINEETGCATSIKPPNDIHVGGRKVAGILVEGRTGRDGSYVAIAGIGVNVNQALDDFPEELRASAGSLAMATGKKIARRGLAITLLRSLDAAALVPGAEQAK
jgi:BirA family biotin operon repressor/biotin-[acetyl-CoA-carboxylase] ligase